MAEIDQNHSTISKERNYKSQKEKLHKVLQRPLFTARLMGLLPFGSKNKVSRNLHKFYFTINAVLLLIVTCQLGNDLLNDTPKDINVVIEIILNIGVYLAALVLLILYRIKVDSLKELIDYSYENIRLHSQFSEEDEVSVEQTMDRLNVALPILIVCTYASSYQWLVLPIFFSGPEGRRLLPVETQYPYSAYDSPYYEITYALQGYLFTLLAIVYSNINATYTAVTVLVCTQFDILCCNIRNSGNPDCFVESLLIPTYNNLTEENMDKKSRPFPQSVNGVSQKYSDTVESNTEKAIADCVEMHQTARKLCRLVESYFNVPLTFQFLMVVLTMGCAVISFLEKFALNTLQFTAISITFLAICCFQGQQILHKSEQIHESVWLSEWCGHSARVRRAYVILMQQGLFPSGLHAGSGMFHLNLTNFIAILRASFSFFTLLDNMIKPDK